MRTITLQQLIDAKACPQQVELFRKHFGESARKAYDGVIASARKAYDEVIASARKTYDEVIASARKAYSEVVAVAFATAYLSQEETK
jgi:transposase-like protein